jgi:hypothetical protein
MSGAQNIECVGGPKDGEWLAVPDGCWELRCAVPVGLGWWQGPLGPDSITVQVGTYAPVTEADRLLHRWIWKAPE